jgi:hypothetical protein
MEPLNDDKSAESAIQKTTEVALRREENRRHLAKQIGRLLAHEWPQLQSRTLSPTEHVPKDDTVIGK